MNDNFILSAESVTPGHPDKLCDQIADAVLDACLENDPDSRVACEVLATCDKILVAGEISTKAMPDIPHIVCRTVRETGYTGNYEVEVNIQPQSQDIADAMEGSGELACGDQAIVYGYATRENKELLPMPTVLAHRITMALTEARKSGMIPWLLPDGKALVSVEYRYGKPYRVASVLVSCQHDEDISLKELRETIAEKILPEVFWDFPLDEKTKVLINPGGTFVQGGFQADTGLTGRKLMVDTYGGIVPHGGGTFSGKDGTKVDRSGAYMARYIAKNLVFAGIADRCTVALSYAIGEEEPVNIQVDTHGTGQYSSETIVKAIRMVFELCPSGSIQMLRLREPIFQQYCNFGHFTHKDAPWEQTDCAELLWEACDLAVGGFEL